MRDGRGLRYGLRAGADLGLALAVDEDRVSALGDAVGADFADVRHGVARANVGDGGRRRVFADGVAREQPVRIALAVGEAVAPRASGAAAATAAAGPGRARRALGATRGRR